MSNYNFFLKNTPRDFSANTIRVAEYLARMSDKSGSIIEVNQLKLSNTLNISRTTVYKAIKKLKDGGILVELNHGVFNKKIFEWKFTKDSFEKTATSDSHKDKTEEDRIVGVGPWPGGKQNWPTEDFYDPELLQNGDRRNVLDHYRYWKMSAIIADLDSNYRTPLHIAIENLEHDYNIGSIVRSANAFGVSMVHIVGRKRWNRRGAMVTDRYQHIIHHSTFDDFTNWCLENDMPIIGIDILDNSKPIEKAVLPEKCMLLFGQEGAGISKDLLDKCDQVLHITQRGSTRSINVGAAAAVAMYTWGLQNINNF